MTKKYSAIYCVRNINVARVYNSGIVNDSRTSHILPIIL